MKKEAKTFIGLVGVVALLCAPLLVVDVPPLLDYPNHLARLWLLAVGRSDPVLAPMFVVQWGVIPNLAIDVVGPPLLRVLPVHVAGRLLLAMVMMLPFFGVLALHRAIFGRLHPWAVASALVMASGAFLLGFLNFVVGIGGALLLAAGWIAGRARWPVRTVVLASLGSAVLFFCHLMGVLFALVLIGAWEARSWRRLLAVLPVAVLPGLLYLAAPLGAVADGVEYLPLSGKLLQLLAPFVGYVGWLDWLTTAAVALFLLASWWRGRLEAPRGVVVALGGLAVLYAVAPYAFKGTQSLDTRFVFMVVPLLFAGLRPVMGRWAMLGFGGLVIARTAVLALAWHGHAADLAQVRAVLADVAPGERVFVASVAPNEAPAYWARAPLARRLSNGLRTDVHLPALALIERRAFWPLLFDEPSQQPVLWVPAYQALADRNGGLVDHLALDRAALCGYDFLLLLGAGGEPDLAGFAGHAMSLVSATDAAALFRVRACAVTPPAG